MISLELPIKTVSEANKREHWAPKHRRAKMQRSVTSHSLRAFCADDLAELRASELITVSLTRIAPRKLDGDNLQRAFKAVRDGVADYLLIDDGSERIVWHYHQRKGEPKEYLVLIEIQADQ